MKPFFIIFIIRSSDTGFFNSYSARGNINCISNEALDFSRIVILVGIKGDKNGNITVNDVTFNGCIIFIASLNNCTNITFVD